MSRYALYTINAGSPQVLVWVTLGKEDDAPLVAGPREADDAGLVEFILNYEGLFSSKSPYWVWRHKDGRQFDSPLPLWDLATHVDLDPGTTERRRVSASLCAELDKVEKLAKDIADQHLMCNTTEFRVDSLCNAVLQLTKQVRVLAQRV